jgi:hypothetical protein
LGIGVLGTLISFVRPRYIFMALALAAFYTAFFFIIGFKNTMIYALLSGLWILLWLGFIVYGHAEKSEEMR